MRVWGFVGASGTGKSYRALWVAKERGIEAIIDDGLLIMDNRVVAGESAKKETTRIASIKRALFVDPNHAEQVRKAIDESNIESLLILGTSDGMVDSIAGKLELPPIVDRVYIEQVATEFEINNALSMRKEQGKHVIPVPTFEIKKQFSGFFLDPLQIFHRKGKGNFQLLGEKSVVRPTFSYRGKYTISEAVIHQICNHVVAGFSEVKKVTRMRAVITNDGLSVEMDLVMFYDVQLKEVVRKLQETVMSEIDRLTALNIISINIVVKNLVLK